jgi:hypothetical protein
MIESPWSEEISSERSGILGKIKEAVLDAFAGTATSLATLATEGTGPDATRASSAGKATEPTSPGGLD